MKFLLRTSFVTLFAMCIAVFAVSPALAAEEHGTSQEAVALVKKAIDYYKKNGAEKTFAAINSQSPDFKFKDLYLYASSTKAGSVLAAHGANLKMVGKDLGEIKDADGKYIFREIAEVVQSKEGKGWIDYKWPNPISKQIEPKTTYVERVDEIYFACGVYK